MLPGAVLAGVCVLVLDDDLDSALLLQFILELEQAQVTVTQHVEAALTALHSVEFDLILSDIMMPEIDGNTFIQTLRSLGQQTPAIAISAAVYAQDKDRALAMGYDRFLNKPVDPDTLIATIVELLQSRPRQTRP